MRLYTWVSIAKTNLDRMLLATGKQIDNIDKCSYQYEQFRERLQAEGWQEENSIQTSDHEYRIHFSKEVKKRK